MKNLIVNCEKGIRVNKKTVHKIVLSLIYKLKLSINSLEISFISSEVLQDINKKYLGLNHRTDIITFDYSNERNNLDGEILISFEDAVENSKKYHVSVENEILRLIIHGILHLIGFDDISTVLKRKMKKVENELVKKNKSLSKDLVNKYDR